MARAQKRLLDHLGVPSLALILGGSLGAMVVWEFLAEHPGFARAAAPIAGAPRTSAWVIALNAVARRAVEADPAWCGGRYHGAGPERGLALARQIAMISYRTADLFEDAVRRGNAPTAPLSGPCLRKTPSRWSATSPTKASSSWAGSTRAPTSR